MGTAVTSHNVNTFAPLVSSALRRTRRHLPQGGLEDNEWRLLRQLDLRIRSLRRQFSRYERDLLTHAERLRLARRRPGITTAAQNTIDGFLARTQQLITHVNIQIELAQRADSSRDIYLRRVDQDQSQLAVSDLLLLERSVGVLEIDLLEMMTNSPLQAHLQYLDGRDVAVEPVPQASRAATGVTPAAPQSSTEGGAAARLRGGSPPAQRVAWGPYTAMHGIDVDIQGLEINLQRYQTAIDAQLTALRSIRSAIAARNGDITTVHGLIRATEAYMRGLVPLQNTVHLFADNARSQMERVRLGEAPINEGEIRVLEAQAVQLVTDLGAYVIAAPIEVNMEYIFQQSMLVGAGRVGAGACGLPGADASHVGAAQSLPTYGAAYHASWETLARLFKHGTWVEGDGNLRRHVFSERGYAEIRAYQPTLSTSGASDAMVAGVFFGGLMAGLGLGGPVSAAIADHVRPSDALWQGYEVLLYSDVRTIGISAEPWARLYFFGWRGTDSIGTAVTVGGIADPRRMPNLADYPDGVTWHRWWSSSADPRDWTWSDALEQSTDPCSFTLGAISRDTDALVQHLGHTPSATAAGDMTMRRPDTRSGEPTVVVVH